jgi:threonine-phosphate decarboxylase
MDHGGRVYEYARQLNLSVESIHDFSANINPLGPPGCVLDAIASLPVSALAYYPDPEQEEVREFLADMLDIDAKMLFCGNGATEVMELIVRCVQPRRVVVLEPAFSEYAAIANRNHVQITRIPLAVEQEFALPLGSLDSCLQKDDLVFLNYPHNPSGRVWPRTDWADSVRAWSRRGVTVVCDESFIDFLPNEDEVTAISLAKEEERVFVVRSATKMYAIPGLRFGYGIGHLQVVPCIEQNRDVWSVNQIAQIAALKAYQCTDFVDRTRLWLKAEQAYIRATWGQSSRLRFFAPSANFFLVELKDWVVEQALQKELQQQKIFVRDCSNFAFLGTSYLRIGIRSHPENELLWQTVSHFLNR